MAITLLSSALGFGLNGDTTSNIDCSGADFILIAVGYQGTSSVAPNDSQSNIYTGLTYYNFSGAGNRLFYCESPSVSSTQNFSFGGTSSACTFIVAAFSGVLSSLSFDVENGALKVHVTSVQPGPITPSEDNELVITSCLDSIPNNTMTIDSGFTIIDGHAPILGTTYGCYLAYKVQTTAAVADPTWSFSDDPQICASIASFKASASGGGGKPYLYYAQQRNRVNKKSSWIKRDRIYVPSYHGTKVA